MDCRLAVLRHHKPVLVVFVRYGKSTLLQSVKQPFLGVAIVVKGLMVVDVIAREVGKQRSVEVQTCDALLCDGMTAYFHEGVFTSCLHHATQQPV